MQRQFLHIISAHYTIQLSTALLQVLQLNWKGLLFHMEVTPQASTFA